MAIYYLKADTLHITKRNYYLCRFFMIQIMSLDKPFGQIYEMSCQDYLSAGKTVFCLAGNPPRSSGDEQHIGIQVWRLERTGIFGEGGGKKFGSIPGFRKNDVSQKRLTGEHRDREWSEAAMDEGKTHLIPGFRKNDVSQKRLTGEHRDREWGEAAMDEGKDLAPSGLFRPFSTFTSLCPFVCSSSSA
jgi:hypothetical protein